MKNLLIFAVVLLALAGICVTAFIGLALYAASRPVDPANAPEYVWVNGIDRCPTSADYGDVVVDAPHLYRDIQFLEIAAEVPHGQQVELIQEFPDSGKVYVEWGVTGYMDSIFVSKYDPASDLQPDDTHCF
jgi:hypothetical protein